MNQQLNNCDRARVDRFLESDQFQLDDQQLIEHLDTCVECREYLNNQSSDRTMRNQIEDLLKPGEFDHASSADCSAATVIGGTGGTGGQPVAIQEVLDSLAPSDDPHRLGRLGTYEISGVVGVGGMGVVLKAVDPSLERVVAIKMMAPALANNEKARRRFAREAKAAAAVLHPNVIPIHSVSSDQAIPFLVMAYVRGGSLQKRLEREGALPLVEVLRIGSQLAAGLAAAHEQGLVHRDIKPENILLEEGVERVTITDFGLARAVDDKTVTQAGTIAGTPMYMSPEQARGEQVDQQSDLFSLGSVLYALCTGRPPYQADTSYGVMRRIIDESPVAVREVNPDVPEWMSRIVCKLMANNKADRFTTASEVHSLLDSCLSHVQQPKETDMPADLQTLLDQPAPSVVEALKATASANSGKRNMAGWSVCAGLMIVVSGFAAIGWQTYSGKQTDRAAGNVRAYLQTGKYDDHPLNDIQVLLNGGSRGHVALKQLDEEFDKIVFATATLGGEERTIAGIVSEGQDGNPHLDVRIWSPNYGGGASNSFGNGYTYQKITIGNGLTHRRNLHYVVSVPPGERSGLAEQFDLEPGGLYQIDVPLIDMLDQSYDYDAVFAAAKLLNPDKVQGLSKPVVASATESTDATETAEPDPAVQKLIGKLKELDKALAGIKDADSAQKASEQVKQLAAEIDSELKSITGKTARPIAPPVPTRQQCLEINTRLTAIAARNKNLKASKVEEISALVSGSLVSLHTMKLPLPQAEATLVKSATPTWASIGLKTLDGKFATDNVKLIQLMDDSRGLWKLTGSIRSGESKTKFSGEVTISGGFEDSLDVGMTPSWVIKMNVPREGKPYEAGGILLALPTRGEIELMLNRSFPSRLKGETFAGQWDLKTQTLSLSEKKMAANAKELYPKAAARMGDAKFQIAFGDDGTISFTETRKSDGQETVIKGQTTYRVDSPPEQYRPPKLDETPLPNGYVIFAAGRREIYLSSPDESDLVGAGVDEIGSEGDLIFGHVKPLNPNSTPTYFVLNSQKGDSDLVKGLDEDAWLKELRKRGMSKAPVLINAYLKRPKENWAR